MTKKNETKNIEDIQANNEANETAYAKFEEENKNLLSQLADLQNELEQTKQKNIELEQYNQDLQNKFNNVVKANNLNLQYQYRGYFVDMPSYQGFSYKTKNGKTLQIACDGEIINKAYQEGLIGPQDMQDLKVIHLQSEDVAEATLECLQSGTDKSQYLAYLQKKVLIVFDELI